jgi:predicted ATP-grasp superfamily ATP-dependent carboligase
VKVLAIAALSARVLAEAATEEGFDVVALDVFGDADTRRACSQWLSIGEPGGLQLDAGRLLSALEMLARRGDVVGWVAGTGFDGRPDLLERGAALLPLIGTPADAVRRVRDPQAFFGLLAAEGIPHPPVQMTAPADGVGWLVKDAHGCGGWHIRRVSPERQGEMPEVPEVPDATEAAAPVSAHHYFQREMRGEPMSATFVANGREARVLGFNQLIVGPFGPRPFVFRGVLGPVPLPAGVARRLGDAVGAIAAAFSLRGLGSLDFMLDGTDFSVLEVNSRPPASMALYRQRAGQATPPGAPGGVVSAHLRACLHGELPPSPAPAPAPASAGSAGVNPAVAGTEIVFAPRAMQLDAAAASRLAGFAGCHDLPAGATRFEAGDPVCSVAASGPDAVQVRALLARSREAVHQLLETHS